ncbi:MAG: aldehyde dehydrogenase [Gammaproteobacteria bacterium]|nr:MAG: aldehyde dehydrogenase [Gammaproteobacteria bacterium]
MPVKQRIIKVVKSQREYFESGATRSYKFRIAQLKKLRKAIKDYELEFTAALKTDLGKAPFESYATEIGFVLHDIRYTIKKLKGWMRPKSVKTPFYLLPGSSKIYSDPLGVNLIIAPFNYPVGLTFAPLVAAIAAGNTAVVKTSELTEHVSSVIEKLINTVFEKEYIAYVPGGVNETTVLLEQKFDHIFFTGSPRVGSIVMEAAAKHLTPVTLELGGKSPCIVHKDANLDIAARRIIYGKMMNAGQTCVAPDYILAHEEIEIELQEKLVERINELYGEDPSQSTDFGRIVNHQHHDRLVSLIEPNNLVTGGQNDRENRYIAPTLLENISLDHKVMQEEIFGPILPILEYKTLDDVFDIVSKLPQHPLACYIFSESKQIQERLINGIQFGGGSINQCINHLTNPELPFGGVGISGIGAYHGYEGFKRFSHQKSVLKSGTKPDLPIAYPPYQGKLKFLRMILK